MSKEGTRITIYYNAYRNDGRIDEFEYVMEYTHKLKRKECELEYANAHSKIMKSIDDPNIIDIGFIDVRYETIKI